MNDADNTVLRKMKTFKFTVPEPQLTRKEKEGKKKIEAPVVEAWMLLLGLFWMFRFWMVREETLWFITLDVYKSGRTAELVDVSLARDGILSLIAGISLLTGYGIALTRYFKERKVEPAGAGQPSHPPENPRIT